MTEPLDEDFRDVGYMPEARNFPIKDRFALTLFAAFNGVRPDQLPPAARYHPNQWSRDAWSRVADAALLFMLENATPREKERAE